MAFLAEELRNFSAKGWLGILGTGDRNTAPDNYSWYEELAPLDTIVKPVQLWNQLSSVPEAADLATAQANAAGAPTIISDLSAVGSAIHLTPSANNKTFFATTVYGDLTTRIGNWIMPQLIPRTDPGFEGFPSIGYMIVLWNDDPATVGVPIGTSVEQSGAVPGWFMNFGAGAIKVASSFTGIVDPTKVYMTGFRYIGTTGGAGGGSGIVDEYDIRNESGGVLNAYTVVKASGDNNVQTRILIDACSSLSDLPIGVLPVNVNNNTNGVMKTFGRLVCVGFDTTGATIGDPVFFNSDGTLTLNRGSMQIGQVASLAANGVVYLNIKEFVYNDYEELAARSIRVDNAAGNDITGDGSAGSPFASVQRAIKNVGSILSEDVTIEFVDTGVDYNWDNMNTELNRFKVGVSGGGLIFKPVAGDEYTTTETNSMTANTHFTHTRAAAGWGVDAEVGNQLIDSSDSEIFVITKNTADTLYCTGSNWFATKPINNYTIRRHNIVFVSTESQTINIRAKVDWGLILFEDIKFDAVGAQFFIAGAGNVHIDNCYVKQRGVSAYSPNRAHYRNLYESTFTFATYQLDAYYCGFRLGSNANSSHLLGRGSGFNYYYRPTGSNVGAAINEDNFRVYNHPAMDIYDCAFDNFNSAFGKLYYQGVTVPTGTFDFSGCEFIVYAEAGARHVTSYTWGAPIIIGDPTIDILTTDGTTATDTLYQPDRNVNVLTYNVADAKTPVFAGYTPQIVENGNRFELPYGLMGFLIEELILDDGIFILDGQLIIEE